MIWINVNDKMPEPDKNFYDASIDVIVTDGNNWGTGYYQNKLKSWLCKMIDSDMERQDINITHWAEPPELPTI